MTDRADRRRPNDRLRAARLSRPSPHLPGEPMSRSELAEAVLSHLRRTTGREYALDAHAVARYERGQVRWPGREYRAALRAVLGSATDDHLGFRPTPRGGRTETRSTSSPVMVEDADVERRSFLAAMGMLITAPEPRIDSELARLGSRKIGISDVAVLRRSVQVIASQTQIVGGGSLHQAATAAYEHVRRLVDESEHSHSVGRELVSVAAEFATCAGWMAYDVGDQQAARRMFTQALLLAGQLGDDASTARVLNAMALQSAHLADGGRRPGHARESLRIAERLAGLTSSATSPRLHALAAGHVAVGRALVGDRDGHRRAVDRAWREADRLDTATDQPRWLHFVDIPAVATFVARGHRYLGEPALAVTVIREHCRLDGVTPWNRVNYQAQLAAILAEAGDAARAVELGRSVIDDMSSAAISSPRTVALLEPVRRISGSLFGDADPVAP